MANSMVFNVTVLFKNEYLKLQLIHLLNLVYANVSLTGGASAIAKPLIEVDIG